jgi:hypothetical protein
MNLFYTCGDENKLGGRPLSETFPGTSSRHTRAWKMINNIKTRNYNFDDNDSNDTEISENSKQNEENYCKDLLTLDNLSQLHKRTEELDSQFPRTGKWDIDTINILREKLQKKRLWWFSPTKRRRCRNRRQAETEKPRMKMDKPFLYLIRHNLTGLILHIGRFNPKNQS